MQGKFGKKKVVKIAVIAGVVVIVLAGGGMVIAGKMGHRTVVESSTDSNRSYEVKKGTISTTVSGTGTLEADDVQDINVLSLLTVDKVYVEAGDVVEKGDLLATVDTVSVKSALQTLQNELESLDSQIEDEKDETVSTKIKSSVSGRVKKIYAAKGDSVTDVMQQDGALVLLSLDGKMAVEMETSESVSVGDDVTVTLSDGSTVDGTVESVSGTKVVVTMTDNGPVYGDTVTVSKDGKTLGSGGLYIHSELTVTGYTGTVASVSVKENQKVSDGTALFKLKDTGKTATYEKLVAERAEVAEALSQVVALYNDPNLYAEFSGTVQSVNCEDAEVVKTESDSTMVSDSSTDGETDSAAGNATSSSDKTDSATGNEAPADGNASSEESEKSSTLQSGGVQGTAAVTGTVYDADSAIRTMQSSGGFVSLGATSVSGGFVQVSATDSAVQTQTSEMEATSTADETDNTTAGSSSTTESGTSADTSGSSESAGSGSTSGSTDTEEDTVISSLQTMVISTPVTGNKVQTGVNSGTGYSAEISWSPSVSQTYAAKTAYTATLTAKASDGYIFDGKLAESYLKAVTADQAQTRAEVSADGKTLTVTAVFAETADTAQAGAQQETQQTQGTQQATGLKMSGGSMSGGAVSGYSVSSASGAASSANTETETTEETLNSYTATTAAFTISTDEKMKVNVSVDEQDILNLSVGQTAQVTLDAVDGETFEGTVTAVNTASGEAANGVTKYTAEVTMDKTDQMLQGMNASVVVTISSAEDCLMIPEAALQENGKTTTVYTTYDASTGTYGGETEVTTGVSDGTSVEILSGLSEGDTVYYSYTESSSDNFGFGMDMGSMQMPGGDMSDRQGKSGSDNGNGPQGGPGGGDRQ